MPKGFGYQYRASDRWLINYMLHNLTAKRDQVWITYDIDFLPATAAAAKGIRAARPVWLDVQNGSAYPVFDALKGSGTDGRFTYPDQAVDPYHGQPAKNTWTADGRGCSSRPAAISIRRALGRHQPHPARRCARAGLACRNSGPWLYGAPVRSEAKYYEPAGAVSWASP